jgi:hypothetical protein
MNYNRNKTDINLSDIIMHTNYFYNGLMVEDKAKIKQLQMMNQGNYECFCYEPYIYDYITD